MRAPKVRWAVLALLLSVTAHGGCKSFRDCRVYPVVRPADSDLAAHGEHQADLQRLQDRKDRRLVWIDARDVVLPQTSDFDEPPDEREYTFFVWAYDPLNPDWDIETLLRRDRLQISVVGAERAKVAPATLVEGSTLPGFDPLNPGVGSLVAHELDHVDELLKRLKQGGSPWDAAQGALAAVDQASRELTAAGDGTLEPRARRDAAYVRFQDAEAVEGAARRDLAAWEEHATPAPGTGPASGGAAMGGATPTVPPPATAAGAPTGTNPTPTAAPPSSGSPGSPSAKRTAPSLADARTALANAIRATAASRQELDARGQELVAAERGVDAARAHLEAAKATARVRAERVVDLAVDASGRLKELLELVGRRIRARERGELRDASPTDTERAPIGGNPIRPGGGTAPTDELALMRRAEALELEVRDAVREVTLLAQRAGVTGPVSPPESVVEDQTLGRGRIARGAWVPNRSMRNVATIKVRSNDIAQSLTIGATFPDLYHGYEKAREARMDDLSRRLAREEASCAAGGGPDDLARDLAVALDEAQRQPNPYVDLRHVRVFNGDLHTEVFMLSKEETIDAFGEMFERYFFVGRTYFRNRHPDKTLVVDTTSIRARCLFYREPNAEAARYFLQSVDGKTDAARTEYFRGFDGYVAERTKAGPHEPGWGRLRPTAARYLGTSRTGIPRGRVAQLARRGAEFGARWSGDFDEKEKEKETEKEVSRIVTAVLGSGDELDVNGLTRTAPPAAGGVPPAARMQKEAGEIVAAAARLAARERSKCGTVSGEVLNSVVDRVVDQFIETVAGVDFPMPIPVTPMDKSFAGSKDIFRQGRMAATGYLFEDFYRPMTFRAVLVSLLAKTKEDPHNEAIRWLEGLGQVVGGLVGADAVAPFLGSKAYAQIAAVSTGVVVPELRKLLLRDVQEFIKNLGTLGLDTVIKIAPGTSVDGYVFFPKGPIFGFGIDEFGPSAPSFIVNIDNEETAVDGLLVDSAHEFSSGVMDAQSLVEQARNEGQSIRSEREREFGAMAVKMRNYALVKLQADVEAAVSTTGKEPDYRTAQALVASFEKFFGTSDPTGALAAVRAAAHVHDVGDPGDVSGRVLLLETTAPSAATTVKSIGHAAGKTHLAAGTVYTGSLKAMLSGPVEGAGKAMLEVEAAASADLAKRVRVTFHIRKDGGVAGEPAAVHDVLGFVNDDAGAESSPRLQHWAKPYEITVRVEVLESLAAAADRELVGDRSDGKGIFLRIRRVVSGTLVGAPDGRSVRIVLADTPSKP